MYVFSVVSLEGRAVHLATLVQEAEQRVSELQAQVRSEGPSEREVSDRERQLKAWEWRLRLFRRMQTGFEHASKSSHTHFDACYGDVSHAPQSLLTSMRQSPFHFCAPFFSLLAFFFFFCLGTLNGFHTELPGT